ncbi:Sulfotransferase domain protein [Pseudooceanicola marinus]|uniref:Sulfotransferase domain protein n=1 Tax=Pseudooceanicola marinus TaxID=396013 RepID=A0A1X7AAB6_9RHOB|nr:sulfotransferase [Pseudooceanicola marinus]SLN74402.1 Sulfotransferase domain protein [Pseudooceanicola marinus]
MLPNFLIAGAEKAGTTWLYDALVRHPDIFLPDVKEVHFFNRFDSNLREIDNFARRGLPFYETHFEDYAGQSAIGEATPMYLCDPEAPQRIRDTLPEAKIVLSLRNPVSRTYSHYRMGLAKKHFDIPLDQAIAEDDARLIQRSRYAGQVTRYFELFPREQVHVLFFEELIADPEPHLAALLRFLGVDDSLAAELAQTDKSNAAATYRSAGVYNAGVGLARALRNNPLTSGLAKTLKNAGVYDRIKGMNRKEEAYAPLSEADRAALVAAFRDDVGRLEGVLHRAVPWKDFAALPEGV